DLHHHHQRRHRPGHLRRRRRLPRPCRRARHDRPHGRPQQVRRPPHHGGAPRLLLLRRTRLAPSRRTRCVRPDHPGSPHLESTDV
ncbi:MAG: hypothetical protein AVDCRST_MAG24-1753, partial [uncultured Nocardioidaceae bacterium]